MSQDVTEKYIAGFQKNCNALIDAGYDEISGVDLYEEIFPDNEVTGEIYTDYSRPNAIFLYQPYENSRKLKRRLMLKDTWREDYLEYIYDNPMTLCSGLTYRGLTNKLENAQNMNALIMDIDGVGFGELLTMLARMEQGPEMLRSIPVPTYLVLSGSGVHLYYVFDEPIPLFPNIKLQLKSLKNALTFRIWDYKGTSKIKTVQYQSINQGFRMPGSVNSKYDIQVRAFRIGGKTSVEELNKYVDDNSRVDITKRFRPSKTTKAEAAMKWPEWYERVVVNGIRKPKKWDIAGKVHGDDPYALYHWWMRKVGEATGGHRYFFMMNMAIYACKCDVPKKQLKEDLNKVFEILRAVPHVNAYGQPDELDEQDVVVAIEAYSKEYYGFKLDDHIATSGIQIERNPRNYLKQEWHLEDIRSKKKNMKERGQAFKRPEGRPKGSGTKQEIVETWRKQNPDGSPKACMQDTGLSKNTVYKWWKQVSKTEPEKSDFSIKLERLGQFFDVETTEPKDDASRLKRLNAYQIGLKKYMSKGETSEEKTP